MHYSPCISKFYNSWVGKGVQFLAPTSLIRTYTYDSLSRLTSESNPESGTVNYTYTETNGLVNDQNGNLIDADSVYQTWHYRRVDLSQFAGKTITECRLIVEGYTQPGRWDAYYHDISVVAADGMVYPLIR